LAESFTCAALYLCFLPWFVFCGLFFLVFIPAYSFARLWDTTWGNRATGKDSAINDKTEDFMKRQNMFFSIFLVIMNGVLLWAFAKLFGVGVNAMISFLFVVFSPIFVQMFCSFLYMFILLPIRRTFGITQGADTYNKKKADDLGIDFDEEGIHDVKSQTFFIDSIFPTNRSSKEHFTNYDDRNFWTNGTSTSSAKQVELSPLLLADEKSSPLPSPHASAGGANRNFSHLLSSNSSHGSNEGFSHLNRRTNTSKDNNDNNSLSFNNLNDDDDENDDSNLRRGSKRLEVAGRYAKV